MKKMKKVYLGVLIVFFITVLLPINTEAASVTRYIKVGERITIFPVYTAYQIENGYNNQIVNWISSNPKVATVYTIYPQMGVVEGKSKGTTYVSCGYGIRNYKIVVGNKSDKKVKATKITLNKSKITLKKGKTYKLKYKLSPSNSTDTITWSSSNKKVATVTSKGSVTAKGPGTATITVKTSSGKKDTCKITVKSPATKVKMSKSTLTLAKGEKYTLKATVSPSNSTDKIKWSSSNKNIATVSSKGIVTAKKTGTVTITAKAGSKKATCKIKIKKAVTKINPTKSNYTLKKGESVQLAYKVSPSGAYATYKWSSSNSKVVSVSNKGKITAKKAGTATITVKASSGVIAKYTVKVIVKTKGVSLNKTSLDIGKGYSYQLVKTIKPSDSTDNVRWSSSDSSVVSVSSSGKITAKKVGTANVTVKSGSFSAKCKVNVREEIPATGLKIAENDAAVRIGDTLALSPVISGPETVTDKFSDIEWSSADESIASVNQYGEVTGNNEGKTFIIAKLRNYEVKYPIVVTRGSWVDISKSEVVIYKSYAKTGEEKIFYDNVDGLTLVQSDTEVTKNISFAESDIPKETYGVINPRRIILSGVDLNQGLSGRSRAILLELMEGTQNYINGNIYLYYFAIEGTGTLDINPRDTDASVEAEQVVYIKGGKIYINRSGTSYYAIRTLNLHILSDAKVYIRGDSKQYYAGNYENIESGTLITLGTAIKGIKITGESNEMVKGTMMTLECEPTSQTDEYIGNSIKWSSSNPKIATVDRDGNVEAIGKGKVTITAAYKKLKATWEIQVVEPSGVDLSAGDVEIYDGYYIQPDVSNDKIPYSAEAGIVLTQSTKASGCIDVEDVMDYVFLIFNGVDAEGFSSYGNDVIIETVEGTKNSIEGGISLELDDDITIQGNGELYLNTYGFALRGGKITIKGGNVIAETTSEYGSAIRADKGIEITDGAKLTDICYSNSISEEEQILINAGKLVIIIKER